MNERSPNAARPNRRASRTTALGLVALAMGALLLAGVGAYYALGLYSSSRLHTLNASFEGAPTLPQVAVGVAYANDTPLSPTSVAPAQPAPDTPAGQSRPQSHYDDTPPVGVLSAPDAPDSQASALPAPQAAPVRFAGVSGYASYPAAQLHPKYWHEPMWAGADVYAAVDTSATNGFIPASELETARKGSNPDALKMSIPAIGVNSTVSERRTAWWGTYPARPTRASAATAGSSATWRASCAERATCSTACPKSPS